eukprot:SAG31_NODE_206_length_20335_cov_17.910160_9_plen_53_part_00
MQIVGKFPAKVLLEHAEYFFVAVSTRLVADRYRSLDTVVVARRPNVETIPFF